MPNEPAPNPLEPPSNWGQARPLLEQWKAGADAERDLHKKAERRRSRQYWTVGIPTVVLSAIVSSAVFGTLYKQSEKFSVYIQVGIGLVSVLATVLVVLDKFLKYQERAALHLALYQQAVAIIQEVDILLLFPPQGPPQPVLESLSRRLSALAGDKIVH